MQGAAPAPAAFTNFVNEQVTTNREWSRTAFTIAAICLVCLLTGMYIGRAFLAPRGEADVGSPARADPTPAGTTESDRIASPASQTVRPGPRGRLAQPRTRRQSDNVGASVRADVSASPRSAPLEVVCNVPYALVSLDGQHLGPVATLKPIQVGPGPHEVLLRLGTRVRSMRVSEAQRRIVVTYSPEEVVAAVRDATCVLETPSGHGAGFLIHSPWIVATALHVVAGERLENLTLQFRRGRRIVQAKVDGLLDFDADRDLAILMLDRPIEDAAPLWISSEPPLPGTKSAIIGNPIGGNRLLDLTAFFGRVARVDGHEIAIDAEIGPGCSGGPICREEDGTVFGLVSYRFKDMKQLAFGYSVVDLRPKVIRWTTDLQDARDRASANAALYNTVRRAVLLRNCLIVLSFVGLAYNEICKRVVEAGREDVDALNAVIPELRAKVLELRDPLLSLANGSMALLLNEPELNPEETAALRRLYLAVIQLQELAERLRAPTIEHYEAERAALYQELEFAIRNLALVIKERYGAILSN